MSNSELIQNWITKVDGAAQEAGQFDSVPMLSKAHVMAELFQAAALERIAVRVAGGFGVVCWILSGAVVAWILLH